MSWFIPDDFRKFIIKDVEKLRNNMKKSLPSAEVDSFINQKYSILEQAFNIYILKNTNQDNKYSKFFEVLLNLSFHERYLYILYIFTYSIYPPENDIQIEYESFSDQYQYMYNRLSFPFIELTDDVIKRYVYFHVVDFKNIYDKNVQNMTVFNYVYNIGLNELLRFYIFYLLKLMIIIVNKNDDIADTDEIIQTFKDTKINIFKNTKLYEDLDNFYESVIDDYDENNKNRFFNTEDYEDFNNVLLNFFSTEKELQEDKIIPMQSNIAIDEYEKIELYNQYKKNNIEGLDITQINPNYLLEYIDEPTSLITFSYANINFNGKNKKIILLGERHDKPGKEVEYIKTEFQKICNWNNKNRTNIKVDFLGESDINYYKFNNSVNLSSFMECTDDQLLKNSASSKYYKKFLLLNKLENDTRSCDINKCFYDIFYSNVDYRLVSSNYHMRFCDFKTFEDIFIFKFYKNDYNFITNLNRKFLDSIKNMENERVLYNYVGEDYYIVFGKKFEKFNISALKDYISKTYMSKYRNTVISWLNDNLVNKTIELLKLDNTIYNYDNLVEYIMNYPIEKLHEYLINDISNLYNYIFKVYFPYLYYENMNDRNMKLRNKLNEYYQNYLNLYGYFPEQSRLSNLKNFYTNDPNIYEYKYCKCLFECIVYVDENIILNYIRALLYNNVEHNLYIYNSLFIYDPYISNVSYFALVRLTIPAFSYMDIVLIHHLLLPYDREDKLLKNHPVDNNNFLVYCGAYHSYTILRYFQFSDFININEYFVLNNWEYYSPVKNETITLKYIPCFSNFFLK